jgi:hypothetical protein
MGQVAKTIDLLQRGWITALQSAQAGGVLSLSQRVTELERNEGMQIERKWVQTPGGARVLAYRIPKGAKPVGVPF